MLAYNDILKQLQEEKSELENKVNSLILNEDNKKKIWALQNEIKYRNRGIIYINDPSVFYHRRYLFNHFKYFREWEKQIGKDLTERYQIKSMIDFGCGCGSYLEGAKETGAEVKGIELMYDIVKDIVPYNVINFIEYGDVMQYINCSKYDCALSIETAEHILPAKNNIFIDNLVNAAKRLIVFTAARPGQGGTGHMNFQSREKWIEMFAERGWNCNDQKVSETQEIWQTILAKKQHYLIRNLIILTT